MLDKTHQPSAWIDNARLIATLAVIIVHVATPSVVNGYQSAGELNSGWLIANGYDSLSRFCVPVFVMLTGALLLPKTITLSNFIRKRVRRLLIPFAFWSMVYLAFYLALKVRDEGHAAFGNLGSWFTTRLIQGTSPHLWYIYMIVGVYLVIPIIKPWALAASNKAILFFLFIWIVTLFIGQQKMLFVNSPLDLRYFSGFVGYLLLGYYLSERLLITREVKYLSIGLFLAGFIITFSGTCLYTRHAPTVFQGFYEYLTINVAMEAVGIFILIKSWPLGRIPSYLFNQIRGAISRYGYGIYLAHLLVLSIMTHFAIDGYLITPLIGIPISALICLAITTLIIHLLNKLPYGHHIFG